MCNPSKKTKLNNNEINNIFIKNENNMSVHNISMNAVLCSSLNLDSIYKYFSNCIYNPREFKCMRIDVPVSIKTVKKYVNYMNNKKERDDKYKLKDEKQEKINEKHSKNEEEKKDNNVNNNIKNNDIKNNDIENEKAKCEKKKEVIFNDKIIDNNKDSMKINENIVKDISICEKENISNNTNEDISDTKNDTTNYIIENITDNDVINKKLIINVSIFSNGKIICTGNNSIEACKIAMKKIEKKLKQLNFKNIKLKKITITNILAVYNVGFSIVLPLFAQYYKSVDYDPNVFPACKVKIALVNDNEKNYDGKHEENNSQYAWWSIKSTAEKEKNKVDIISASIFSTGNITLTGGKSYENLQKCIEILLPYLIKSKSQH
ncbi:transcription initiation TFIID-like, putative [Plasmodium gallinaceum]|uniref:Transcription initiation TFIID-like, putative n=1 Tax=Plasmodium gallinaceum TaxID=5849 RepID=A0A1J1GTL4_PLAGA|nr:transcription initiation TFIID-like, putative [Plasmodium gallinaceum]CRG95791.1 transcription initiation TFIID-like, putative [Plasmodium gallinaceum]